MKKILFLSPVVTSCVPQSPNNLFPPQVEECSFDVGDEVAFSGLRICQHKSDSKTYLDGTVVGGLLDGCYVFNIPSSSVGYVKKHPIKKASCVVLETWCRMPLWAKIADCLILSALLAILTKIIFRKTLNF